MQRPLVAAAVKGWVDPGNHESDAAHSARSKSAGLRRQVDLWAASCDMLDDHESIDDHEERLLALEADAEDPADPTGYATEAWVIEQNYLTSTELSGYATELWVGFQGYGQPIENPNHASTRSLQHL